MPIVREFQARHEVAHMLVVADAGMLSGVNLTALEAADLHFIVGSRTTKAPIDLAPTSATFEGVWVTDACDLR